MFFTSGEAAGSSLWLPSNHRAHAYPLQCPDSSLLFYYFVIEVKEMAV